MFSTWSTLIFQQQSFLRSCRSCNSLERKGAWRRSASSGLTSSYNPVSTVAGMGRTVPSTLTQVKDILCWGQNRGKLILLELYKMKMVNATSLALTHYLKGDSGFTFFLIKKLGVLKLKCWLVYTTASK